MSRTAPPTQFFRGSEVVGQRVAFKPVTLELPPAHPRQYEFLQMLHTEGVRFAVGACGTKFGKTYGTTAAITEHAWDTKDSMNWWVSPTFAQSKMAFEHIKKLLPDGMYRPYAADLKIVILTPSGTEWSVIEFKSADNPDSLRGFGVNFFVFDEAARGLYESWVSLITTVTQTMGCGYVISTPKGRNWFYDVYQWGVKEDEDGNKLYLPGEDPHPEFLSIRMPTWTNPHVSMAAVNTFKSIMPEDVFRQEVGAQFLVESAGVFRGIRECEKGLLYPPIPKARYIMGVDLARLKDYSTIFVMDVASRHVCHFDRFKDLSWEVQYRKIIETSKRYNNAVCCMDATGIGDPIVQSIENSGVRVIPYKISSSQAKQQLIDKLRVNIEKRRISFPTLPVVRRELEAYEYEISASGTIKFSAPTGKHDDCVIGLALVNWISDVGDMVYHFRQVRGV